MRIAPILQAERGGRYIEMDGSSGKSGIINRSAYPGSRRAQPTLRDYNRQFHFAGRRPHSPAGPAAVISYLPMQ